MRCTFSHASRLHTTAVAVVLQEDRRRQVLGPSVLWSVLLSVDRSKAGYTAVAPAHGEPADSPAHGKLVRGKDEECIAPPAVSIYVST